MIAYCLVCQCHRQEDRSDTKHTHGQYKLLATPLSHSGKNAAKLMLRLHHRNSSQPRTPIMRRDRQVAPSVCLSDAPVADIPLYPSFAAQTTFVRSAPAYSSSCVHPLYPFTDSLLIAIASDRRSFERSAVQHHQHLLSWSPSITTTTKTYSLFLSLVSKWPV